MKINQELVMNRKSVADSIDESLKVYNGLLKQDVYSAKDMTKINIIRSAGPLLKAAIAMIETEVAQERHMLILERMKQLGYKPPKELKE